MHAGPRELIEDVKEAPVRRRVRDSGLDLIGRKPSADEVVRDSVDFDPVPTTMHWKTLLIYALAVTNDVDVLKEQLGYIPSNFCRVSAWSHQGRPVAIQTYPLDGGAERRQRKARSSTNGLVVPFPTLYWLTCPDVSRAIADLERRGFVKKIQEHIMRETNLRRDLWKSHELYAQERWELLTEEDRQLITPRMASMLSESGIAGTNLTALSGVRDEQIPSVKCLHSHYAYYRSGGEINPVGHLVGDILRQSYPALIL